MRVGVIGINHKLADLEEREALAKLCRQKFGVKCCLHEAVAYVLLSTCNRTEIYFSDEHSSKELSEIHTYLLTILKKGSKEPVDHKLYSYFGSECFRHLVEVTAGFDSAVKAETEIQGQVKEAYLYAARERRLSPSLHYLFQKSLKIGKDVRHLFKIGRGLPTFEQTIFKTGAEQFFTPQNASILIVGASRINEKITSFLQKKACSHITLCNRCPINGTKFSAKFNLRWLPWENLHEWENYDWIILGTKASDYLLRYEENKRSSDKKKLVLDLGMPRNADPRIAFDPHVKLRHIDQLNATVMQEQSHVDLSLFEANQYIDASIRKHSHLFTLKQRHKPLEIISLEA